jgi:hypothetical protein
MLERIGQAFRIGIGRDSIALVRTRRWRGPRMTVVAECAFVPEQGMSGEGFQSQLARLMADIPGAHWPVSVVVADDLTRLWRVTPPTGVTRQSDLEAAAEMRFQTLYGDPLMDWKLAADWDAREPFFAAAMPGWLFSALEEEGRRKKVMWIQIAPQFLTAWNYWRVRLAPGAWFANVHDSLLTLGVVQGRHLVAVRSTPLPPDVDSSWLSDFLQRQSLLLNMDAPRSVAFCGPLAVCEVAQDSAGIVRWSRLDHATLATDSQSLGVALAQTGVWP